MIFSSIPFLYYFLPIVLCIYFITPNQLKNLVLLIASLIFYGYSEPKIVIVMMISVGLGYLLGIGMEKDAVHAKMYLILSLVTSLGMLGYFKYTNFFIENIASITHLPIKVLNISLPVGISFYTFQLLSYTIDVYRQKTKAQHSLIKLATYIALFPQLIAGPIVRYTDIEKQLDHREYNFDRIAEGMKRFILGLSKKVLIANALGEFTNIFRASNDQSFAFYWLYAIAFTLHIYFDFSGYSDMAIGLGKILGFDFIENFNYPYISKSITEFWRRWHISLGSWFRDYVYIPLGGNRVSQKKWLRNILIVWFLTGFWHGASWNFIVWGLLYACLLVLEKYVLKKHLESSKVFSHIYTMFFVVIGFVIFNATNMQEALNDILALLGLKGLPFVSKEFFYYARSYLVTFILALFFATPIYQVLLSKVKKNWIYDTIEIITLCSLLVIVTAYLVDGSFNPFLYFRF